MVEWGQPFSGKEGQWWAPGKGWPLRGHNQVLESQLERQLMMPARQSLPPRGDGSQGEGQELVEVKSLQR